MGEIKPTPEGRESLVGGKSNNAEVGGNPIRHLWVLLFPILYYLPGIGRFPYASGSAAFSDLVISHLPNLIFLKKSLLAGGSIPFWSPLILSGAPFAANPLSGLWYPPGWLALLLPIPLGINLLVMAHLLGGGYGVYRLMRMEGVGSWAAVFAGLGFAALPKLAAHYGAGHLTLLYAVPWTPWLLGAWGSGSQGARYRRAGGILALIFLADVRWAAYAGTLGIFWGLAHSQKGRLGGENKGWASRALRWGQGFFVPVVAHLVLAAMLAAPLALPLAEYTTLSTRAYLSAVDVLAFSLPPARLLGLIFPDFGGNPEWMLYPGAVILALGLLAYIWPKVRRAGRFWVWALPISLLYSLGEHIPGMVLAARLPGFSLLRVPPRALFLSGLSLTVLAAYSLDHVLAGLHRQERRRAGLGLAALAGFGLILAVGVRVLTGAWVINFFWGGLALTTACFWLLAGFHKKIPIYYWFAGLLLISLLDWGVVNQSLIEFRSPDVVYDEGAEAARFLEDQEGLFRTYSPSYSLPQQTSARASIELADGVDPLQLRTYAGFMAVVSGVPNAGYSVTIPPYAAGKPALDNAAFTPDSEGLGWLNVRYILAEFDLYSSELVLVERFGVTRIYENQSFRPRAWVQSQPTSIGPILGLAEISDWRPNQIGINAAGPGILVLSEIVYPGWEVRVDGNPAGLITVGGLLRGVSLPAGPHEVLFDFKPLSVYLGLAAAVSALTFLLGGFVWSRRSKKLDMVYNQHVPDGS
jgi:hypothetical protein